ncbi:MAG TPA: type IV toxin-antitoxin system AbiEi family antitoxin domain-containing protein [Marmoricola sp.]|nr:type IV toxin-antitoxin system AbiEi family antitoxin domain-containing protein [Marmoricola sp.]
MQITSLPDCAFRPRDLPAPGLSRHGLERAVRDGEVRRVLRGVYVRSDVPDTVATRVQAAGLVLPAGSVVRDRFAAWIHGIDIFQYAETAVLPPIETCVLRGSTRSRRSGIVGRSRDLAVGDCLEIDGVLVTTPLRTALDLGCNLWRRDALHVLDRFLRDFGTRVELRRGAVRYFRRRGVVQLRELIPLADGRAESRRESWTRIEIIDANLPTPVPQWWIEIDGVPTYRLDLAYPRHRIAVEYDGEEFHLRTEEQRKNDRERRKWLRDHGWTVIVVRNGDFTRPGLDRWLGELREALRPQVRPLRFR